MPVAERVIKRNSQLDEETVTEIQRTLSNLLARLEASMRAALDEARTNEISRTEDVVAQASETQHEEIRIELMKALPFVQRCGDCQARIEFASPRAAGRLAESWAAVRHHEAVIQSRRRPVAARAIRAPASLPGSESPGRLRRATPASGRASRGSGRLRAGGPPRRRACLRRP